MPNPYVCCGRIQNPDKFVGRERELREIFDALETAHTGQLQSVSIVGPRRMGRSSLLTYVSLVYGAYLSQSGRYIVAYNGLQSSRYATDLNALLRALLEDLKQATPAERLRAGGPVIEQLERTLWQREITLSEFEATVRRFRDLARPLYPVFCLDELEQLTRYPDRFPDPLYDSWRSLMSDGAAAFVIATSRPLFELAEDDRLTSPFFNIFSTYIPLGEFTTGEVDELIRWGRTCDRPFDDEDARRLLQWGGRHPLKLQQAGRAIYDAKGRRSVIWKQVEDRYRETVRQQFGRRTRQGQVGHWLRQLPDRAGRIAMFWKDNADTDAETRRLVGGIVLACLVLLVALAILFPDLTWQAISQRFLSPSPTPAP